MHTPDFHSSFPHNLRTATARSAVDGCAWFVAGGADRWANLIDNSAQCASGVTVGTAHQYLTPNSTIFTADGRDRDAQSVLAITLDVALRQACQVRAEPQAPLATDTALIQGMTSQLSNRPVLMPRLQGFPGAGQAMEGKR